MTEESKKNIIIIVCSRCGKERKHGSKGMCKACYNTELRLQKHYSSPMIKCICSSNCNKMIHRLNKHGEPMSFYPGHATKGKNSSIWKGGLDYINGYTRIKLKGHPSAGKNGRIMLHRIVYEMYHMCCLLPWADIHHRDGNKKRNHPENLEALFHNKHSSLTNKGRKHKPKIIRRKCYDCGSTKTYINKKNNSPQWYRVKEIKQIRYRCQKCKDKLRSKKNKKLVLRISGECIR